MACAEPSGFPVKIVDLKAICDTRSLSFSSSFTFAAIKSLVRTHSKPPEADRSAIIKIVNMVSVLMLPLETTRSYTWSMYMIGVSISKLTDALKIAA